MRRQGAGSCFGSSSGLSCGSGPQPQLLPAPRCLCTALHSFPAASGIHCTPSSPGLLLPTTTIILLLTFALVPAGSILAAWSMAPAQPCSSSGSSMLLLRGRAGAVLSAPSCHWDGACWCHSKCTGRGPKAAGGWSSTKRERGWWRKEGKGLRLGKADTRGVNDRWQGTNRNRRLHQLIALSSVQTPCWHILKCYA